MSAERILMILDDSPAVGRALARTFEPHFDQVHAFTRAADATALLERAAVTHVICDQCLGSGDPSGLDLIPRWRRSCASIERAVLITGMDCTGHDPAPEIDAIVSKLSSPDEFIRILRGG